MKLMVLFFFFNVICDRIEGTNERERDGFPGEELTWRLGMERPREQGILTYQRAILMFP